MINEPLVFSDIFQYRIWGGQHLRTHFNKDIPHNELIGESWEISTVKNHISQLKNEHFKGVLITELINKYPKEILGNRVYKQYGNEFPLLFKLLDAQKDLSIQVHPNDELAQKRHQSFGKTEMWVILHAEPDAKLIVGFKKDITKDIFLNAIETNTIESYLKYYPVQKGDVFFIDTGVVHAIGAGVMIAEIQQTSDITYRVFDWNRIDKDGKTRELHVDLALDAINYNTSDNKIEYSKKINELNQVVNCPYFETKFLPLNGSYKANQNIDSFVVMMIVSGSVTIQINNKQFQYNKGTTLLIPACMTEFELIGNCEIIWVQMP